MRKFSLFILVVLTVGLLTSCGGKSQPKVYPHSKQFIHQAQAAHFPSSKLLTGLPVIPGYDAVDTSSLPTNAQAVGCYAGPGIYNCTAAHNRAPNAKLVSIAQHANVPAKCLDTELGDATPSEDIGWVKWMISRGEYRPCIYASLSTMPQVKANLASLPRSSYLLWVAAWDNNPAIPAGYDGKQWFGNTHCCYDRDTFGTWFFAAPPKPDLHNYSWFTTLSVKNSHRGGPCYYGSGCQERRLVKRYDVERQHPVKNIAALHADEGRLLFLDSRLQYLIHHRSVKINGDTRTYGREHELYNRGNRHHVCNTWKECDY